MGLDPPKPVCSFAHFNFDESLMKAIRKSDYTQPTAIQAQVTILSIYYNIKACFFVVK